MTERSTRRAAEMAIIDAAVALTANADSSDIGGGTAADDLIRAVDEYEALGLHAPDRHVTGNNNPDTSHEAGARLRDITGDCRKVFDEIVVGGGLSCDQVEQKLNRTHQTISARVNQLRDWGWIVDSGHRRPTRSGRSAIVWRPTIQAINQGGF
jgi:hypothetical protein